MVGSDRTDCAFEISTMKTLVTLSVAALALGLASPSEAQTAIRTKRIIASGLTYPTFVTHAPGDSTRLFILEKGGRIRIYDRVNGTLLTTPFLTVPVTGGTSLNDERGLLGLAFDPNYATNGQFYVYYTGSGTNGNTLARYTVSANPNIANTTGQVMMSWSDPYSNHNGGWIGFGPDGNLYMGTGDGGSANDPLAAGQSLTTPLGKIHRLRPTVGGSAPYYTIPSDNPFVGGSTADDTIWSYGIRNPWRCSFDRQTGDLWIADVGQNATEEINFQAAGANGGRNYGWRCREGNGSTGLSGCTSSTPLVGPIHTYGHVSGTSGGYSITGGYVYRGCRIPDLQGTYFFADWVSNNVWSFRYENGQKTEFLLRNSAITPSLDNTTVNQIASFGEDAEGEMYIVDHGGQVYKIVPASGDGTCEPPAKPGDLNGDGLVDGADLGILLSKWGGCIGCASDFNDDGAVDGIDLGVLLGMWD
jgi:glucose/arabinose dehydrogenase